MRSGTYKGARTHISEHAGTWWSIDEKLKFLKECKETHKEDETVVDFCEQRIREIQRTCGEKDEG